MSSNKTSFEERLARLQSQEPLRPTTKPEQGHNQEATERRPRQTPNRSLVYFALVICGVMIPAFFLVFVFKDISGSMRDMQTVAINTTTDAPSQIQQDPGGLRGYIGRKLGLYDSRNKGPLPFMPKAPEGWVRVTIMDARESGALERLHEEWPKAGRGVHLPLAENAGYRHLTTFLRIYRKPDIEQRVLAETRTRAMYLHPNGDFMSVGIQFTGETNALGNPDDRSSWIDALVKRVAKKAGSDETVERNRLAGYDIANLTKREGLSLVRRPIGYAYGAKNGLRISVPLTHRAIMTIDGVTTPNLVAEIISAVDQPALVELLN